MARVSLWGPSLGLPLELQGDLAAVKEVPWKGFGTLLIKNRVFKDVSHQITIFASPEGPKTRARSLQDPPRSIQFRFRKQSEKHVAKQVAVPQNPEPDAGGEGDPFCSLLGW